MDVTARITDDRCNDFRGEMPVSPVRAKDTLGAFLRSRREALSPEDIGLRRGSHRRAGGLRREEVAELCGISTDYIGRLERGSGPWPSNEVLTALARGLRLRTAERNHLFSLCGRTAPLSPASEHIDAGIQRILDRLDDTPAQVMGQAGVTLRQTPAVAALLDRSDEFRAAWERREVGLGFPPGKHLDHPEVGGLDLYCQALFDGGSGQLLLVFTAAPGSESHDRLALLNVVGRQLLE
jgi:transcriptional regulator with XRE-family HTH domain